MTDILLERIRSVELTKKQKMIADYFLKNQERLGSLSSMETANEIGVSDASVIRFCRTIGYKGFADLKEHIYSTLVEDSFSGLSLSERAHENEVRYTGESVNAQYFGLIQKNVSRTFTQNAEEDYRFVSDRLLNARRRYIIGLRGCKGIAVNFGRLLSFMLPNVITITDGECTSFSSLQDVTPEDLVLMFIFPRYYKVDLVYAQMAKNKDVPFCLVTSDPLGPIAPLADKVLLSESVGMSFFNSTIGTSLIGEYLLTQVGRQLDYKDRLEARDAFTEPQRL